MKRVIGILITIWLVSGNINNLNAQSISSVKSSLGETTNALSLLSASGNINKWSKYKPVPGLWPAASNGKYSIDPFSAWSYGKPTDNYRLGDFRNYNPNAKPPVYMDEDGSYEETNLYPTNSPDHSDWDFVVNASPLSGELSYGDLGLSNYYVGFKVTVPGGTVYYKSYDAITSFSSKVITISAALNSHVLPYSFTNLPYGVGNFTMEFGFCSGQTIGWSTSNPGFYLLPDVTPTLNCINSYSFVIHPWAYLTVTTMGFSGSGYIYQASHISTSLSNWQVISKPSWIALTVYQSGSQITNAALWATEMDIRIVPNSDNTSGSTRNGTVEIGAGTSVLSTISVSQDMVQNPPDVTVSTTGFSVSSSSGSVAYGSTTLSYSLTPTDVGLNVLCNVQLKKNGNVIDTSTIFLKDNTSASSSFTLSTAADYNDVYVVNVSN